MKVLEKVNFLMALLAGIFAILYFFGIYKITESFFMPFMGLLFLLSGIEKVIQQIKIDGYIYLLTGLIITLGLMYIAVFK